MNTNIPLPTEQAVEQLYISLRHKLQADVPLTVLQINAENTLLAFGKNLQMPGNIWMLNIGSEKTAQDFFAHQPPTPGEVENAIQEVEDEVMTLTKLLAEGSVLCTADSRIREIGLLAGNESLLLRSDMEAVFGRLAAIISGRPASQDHLPADSAFAATLLILREIMFHLKFEEIRIS
jgi:Exopolyphosphatase